MKRRGRMDANLMELVIDAALAETANVAAVQGDAVSRVERIVQRKWARRLTCAEYWAVVTAVARRAA